MAFPGVGGIICLCRDVEGSLLGLGIPPTALACCRLAPLSPFCRASQLAGTILTFIREARGAEMGDGVGAGRLTAGSFGQ